MKFKFNPWEWHHLYFGIILIGLFASTTSAFWDDRCIPWDATETPHSITEMVAVGGVLPTSSYLIWNRCSPTHRTQKRMMRIVVCHLATAGLAMATLRGPSLHDEDPRYSNIVMMTMISMPVNILVDGFRTGWWKKKVWEKIRKKSKEEKMDELTFILIVAGVLVVLSIMSAIRSSQKSKEIEENDEDIRNLPGQEH